MLTILTVLTQLTNLANFKMGVGFVGCIKMGVGLRLRDRHSFAGFEKRKTDTAEEGRLRKSEAKNIRR